MDVQEELKALKVRIAELEEQAKEEQEFPQDGDTYWYIGKIGTGCWGVWEDSSVDKHLKSIGNVFRTKEQAEFSAEKLKVEAELWKFSRPFILGEENWYLDMVRSKDITISYDHYIIHQGTVYFESKSKVKEVIELVGEERIKKYIFGVED